MFDLPLLDTNVGLLLRPSISFIDNASATDYDNIASFHYLKYYYFTQSKERNIKTLDAISSLPKNWNENDADAFEKGLVDKAKQIVSELKIQPKIFPTGNNSIQLEYEKTNGDYLEFEIFNDRIKCFSIIKDVERTVNLANTQEITDAISTFYDR